MSEPMIVEPRFIFRGNAFGIGGQIREPYMPYFEVQAASSLPTVGGLSRAEAKGLEFAKLFSFGFARTEARGGVQGNGYTADFRAESEAALQQRDNTTIVTSEVFDVHVEGRLIVRRMIMGLRSHEEPGAQEPSIVPEQTDISGATLDGCVVEVILDAAPFRDASTKSDLRRQYKNRDWREKYGPQIFRGGRRKRGEDSLFESKSLVLATIVKEIKIHHDPDKCDRHQGRVQVSGNRIVVPNFGKIYFGEMIVSDHYRRLSAMRLELGSPMRASMECAGVESNGGGAP